MTQRFCTVLFLVFISTAILHGQLGLTISGTILEKGTKKPLESANVFLSSTTLGTRSDAKGRFILKNIPPGSYDLIVSYVGYQSQATKIAYYKHTTIELDFFLEQTPVKLNEIQVNAPKPEEWHENFEVFKREFIGETDNAELTKIQNPEVIELNFDKESKTLTAHSDSSIIVENRALGYKLYVLLERIEYEQNTQKYTYAYYPRFEELIPESEKELNEWKNNRATTYQNSMRFFFKSLFYKTLYKEDFKIFSGRLTNLLNGLGVWTSQDQFVLLYNADSTFAEFSFDKSIKVIKTKESIVNIAGERITIDKYGNLIDPVYIQIFRWWGKLRTADLLPFDYVYNK